MTTPGACTLPTAERPLRLAEFESLFAQHLISVECLDDRTAAFLVAGERGVASTARDLVDRESGCCSFFSFDVQESPRGAVTMTVRVSRRHRRVLRAMVYGAVRVPR